MVLSEFNSNKSQLKAIEAGFHKKALIASNVPPYTLDLVSAVDEGKFNDNGNALLVGSKKNHKDWAKHMKRLIENPNMPDREVWIRKLAQCHWSFADLRSGRCWAHMRQWVKVS